MSMLGSLLILLIIGFGVAGLVGYFSLPER